VYYLNREKKQEGQDLSDSWNNQYRRARSLSCLSVMSRVVLGICLFAQRLSGAEIAGDNNGVPEQMIVYHDYAVDDRLIGGRTVQPLQKAAHLQQVEAEAWDVEVVIDNGPVSNRIDLVILGDGYTGSELELYASHTDSIMADVFATEPFAAYSSYFNVHRVDVISNESGIDDSSLGIYRDTALDMAYAYPALRIDFTKVLAAAACAIEVDHIIAMANSAGHAGVAAVGPGLPGLAIVTADNGDSADIVMHELGHAMANLADEYSGDNENTYTGDEPSHPNISIYDSGAMALAQIKWYRWLDLPHVGTFEGAYYKKYGIYRPTYNSKMRRHHQPFQEVNVEQLVLTFYKLVSPIDDATPPATHPLPADCVLFVTPMEPTDHLLDIQWSVDGEPVAGATGRTFDVNSVPRGFHEVLVTVVDNTPRVRDESARATWLTETRSWPVSISPAIDFDDDGIVNGKDFSKLAQYWLQDEISVDIAPPPYGDGRVDFADLAAFSDNWLTATTIPPLPTEAINPSPADLAVDVDVNADLSWTPGSDALSHDIHFGTTDPPPFVSSQTEKTFDPGTLPGGPTYYWRIDEKNNWGKTEGEVWRFTTVMPQEAWGPTPENGAELIPTDGTMTWNLGDLDTTDLTLSYNVYIGTDQAAVTDATTSSLEYVANVATESYDYADLEPGTEHFWRVDTRLKITRPPFTSVITPGNIWSFTTVP
jgi:hypothetical protein